MMNLKQSLIRLFQRKASDELTPSETKKVPAFAWLFLVLSFAGFLVALYLAIKKIYAGPISCFIFTGCDTVQNSVFQNFLGVPVAFWGVMFYLVLMFLIIRYIETKNFGILKLFFYLTIPGALFSLYLIYLQLFVIKAICVYCVITDSIVLFLFITSYLKVIRHKRI